MPPKDKIFIAHGRDKSAKKQTARFIEKLGLKLIILHEQVSLDKTIIEKIEEYSDVRFGIVLYRPLIKVAKVVKNLIYQTAPDKILFSSMVI
jgi:predicted nucleotide-binding protein